MPLLFSVPLTATGTSALGSRGTGPWGTGPAVQGWLLSSLSRKDKQVASHCLHPLADQRQRAALADCPLRRYDQALALMLHPPGGSQERPFSVTPVLGADGRPARRCGPGLHVRVGVTVDALRWLFVDALSGAGALGSLAAEPLVPVLDAPPTHRPFEQSASSATSCWSVDLVTPTVFRSTRGQGRTKNGLLPNPVTVFTWLARRWERWGGPPLPTGLLEVVAEAVEVHTAGNLNSSEHLVKGAQKEPPLPAATQTGITGKISWRVADPDQRGSAPARPDREDLRALTNLIALAQSTGLGDHTAVGMGALHVDPANTRHT